jgi:hypothetical protein
VVAEGGVSWVYGHDEEVAEVQFLQDGVGVASVGDRLAQSGGQFGQNRSLQQKGAHGWLLLIQHLLGQKVKDVAVGLGQVGDEGGAVGGGGDASQRTGQQSQTRGPALGAGVESGQVARGEIQEKPPSRRA